MLSGVIGAAVTIISLYPMPLISILTAMAAGGLLSCFMFPVLLGIYWKRCTRGAPSSAWWADSSSTSS